MAYDSTSSEGREKAESILRIHGAMEAERANWDSLYQSIAEYLFPRGNFFNQQGPLAQGQLRGEKVFDNTPTLALDRFAAALDSLLTPRNQKWAGLRVRDDDLNEVDEVREYLEHVNAILFAARYSPKANFASQMHEFYLSLGAFGTGGLFIDENMGQHLRYSCLHLSELCFAQNHQGVTDRVHRKLTLQARQAAQKFGRDNLPEKIRNALDQPGKEFTEFDFVHCVYPNEDIDPRRMDHRGMAFSSAYVTCDQPMVVMEKGYRTMPYAVGRYTTGPREIYGRSPAMTVLRDVMMLNEMNKTVIRQGQMAIAPPILMAEDGALQPFSMRPGALNYGGVTEDGKPLALPINVTGDMQVGLEMIQDRRTAVNDAFLVTLFQILVENPNQTATEALIRAQEKGQLLGPALGRQQSETLGVMIERELDVLAMAGQLPPMPDVLREMGAEIEVEYTSPLNRLQRSDEAVGILRLVESLTGPAQVDPSVYDIIDFDKATRILGEALGTPAKALRSPEEMDQMREQRQNEKTLGEVVQAAPAIASTIKDISQAAAVGGNSPQPIPQVQPA